MEHDPTSSISVRDPLPQKLSCRDFISIKFMFAKALNACPVSIWKKANHLMASLFLNISFEQIGHSTKLVNFYRFVRRCHFEQIL